MKPFTREQYEPYLKEIRDWEVVEDRKIRRDYKFRDFAEALSFVNKVGAIAQRENHHPDLFLHNWNRVRISLTTHAIKGLSKNDFIMAAKIDEMYRPVLLAQPSSVPIRAK
jgi:4a-hydroxytetrahydrobiopterin dehydratase